MVSFKIFCEKQKTPVWQISFDLAVIRCDVGKIADPAPHPRNADITAAFNHVKT
jgi:hypothetical protein